MNSQYHLHQLLKQDQYLENLHLFPTFLTQYHMEFLLRLITHSFDLAYDQLLDELQILLQYHSILMSLSFMQLHIEPEQQPFHILVQ